MNLLNYRYIFIKNFDNFIWISSLSSSSSKKCQNFIRKWSSSSSSNHRDDHHHFINSFNCSTSQFNKFSLPYQSLLLNNNYYQSDTSKSMTTITAKIFDKRYFLVSLYIFDYILTLFIFVFFWSDAVKIESNADDDDNRKS